MFKKKERQVQMEYERPNNMQYILSNIYNTLKGNSENGRFIYKEGQENIKNSELLSLLMIRGQYAHYNSEFSDEEIHIALCRAREYLDVYIMKEDEAIIIGNTENLSLIRPVSPRQVYCSNLSIKFIMEKKYNHALHEFSDCIADFAQGEKKAISISEYALYNCIISCFIAVIEDGLKSHTLKPVQIYKL